MDKKTKRMKEATFGANRRGPVNRYGEYDDPPQWETQDDRPQYQIRAEAELAQMRAQTQTEPAEAWANAQTQTEPAGYQAPDAAGAVSVQGPPGPSPEMREILRERDEQERAQAERAKRPQSPTRKPDWTKVSNAIVFDPDLKPGPKVVLVALLSYDWKVNGYRKGYAEPALDTLAAGLGLHHSTVLAGLGELERLGYIETWHGGGRKRCNRYHLTAKAQRDRD
jgi:hypothetical protein